MKRTRPTQVVTSVQSQSSSEELSWCIPEQDIISSWIKDDDLSLDSEDEDLNPNYHLLESAMNATYALSPKGKGSSEKKYANYTKTTKFPPHEPPNEIIDLTLLPSQDPPNGKTMIIID